MRLDVHPHRVPILGAVNYRPTRGALPRSLAYKIRTTGHLWADGVGDMGREPWPDDRESFKLYDLLADVERDRDAEWRAYAACLDIDTAAFYATGRKTLAARDLAATVCPTCPVREECAAYADEHDERGAVWGGTYRGVHPTTREPYTVTVHI